MRVAKRRAAAGVAEATAAAAGAEQSPAVLQELAVRQPAAGGLSEQAGGLLRAAGRLGEHGPGGQRGQAVPGRGRLRVVDQVAGERGGCLGREADQVGKVLATEPVAAG